MQRRTVRPRRGLRRCCATRRRRQRRWRHRRCHRRRRAAPARERGTPGRAKCEPHRSQRRRAKGAARHRAPRRRWRRRGPRRARSARHRHDAGRPHRGACGRRGARACGRGARRVDSRRRRQGQFRPHGTCRRHGRHAQGTAAALRPRNAPERAAATAQPVRRRIDRDGAWGARAPGACAAARGGVRRGWRQLVWVQRHTCARDRRRRTRGPAVSSADAGSGGGAAGVSCGGGGGESRGGDGGGGGGEGRRGGGLAAGRRRRPLYRGLAYTRRHFGWRPTAARNGVGFYAVRWERRGSAVSGCRRRRARAMGASAYARAPGRVGAAMQRALAGFAPTTTTTITASELRRLPGAAAGCRALVWVAARSALGSPDPAQLTLVVRLSVARWFRRPPALLIPPDAMGRGSATATAPLSCLWAMLRVLRLEQPRLRATCANAVGNLGPAAARSWRRSCTLRRPSPTLRPSRR